MKNISHVHFIGIAGSAIAPIAKMMKDLGWKVTGYEHNQVWEPMKSFLKDNNIEYSEIEHNFENLQKADLVVLGGSVLMKDKNDPEFLEAKKLGKKIVGYEQLLQDFVVKKNSVVIAGTYGKTTISSMLAWILETAKLNPSYMSGGQQLNFDSGVRSTDSDYSVVEGDEYVSVWGFDMEPRFVYYKPNHTLITSAKWDHVNVYPMEESYVEAFKKLAKKTEENSGIMLLCATGDNLEKVKKSFKGKVYTYMMKEKSAEKRMAGNVDYTGEIIEYFPDKTVFRVYEGVDLLWEFETTMIGDHNVENCVASIAMARILGISVKSIDDALKTFKGIGRRQEVVGKMKSGATVMDDFAHSPIKAKATLEALRTRYKGKIIAIFNAHATSLADRETLKWYPGVFDKADFVIIPKITVKKSTPKEKRVYGKDVVDAIAKTQPNVEYIPVEENIVKKIQELADKNSLVVFMSSGGWGKLVLSLSKYSKCKNQN